MKAIAFIGSVMGAMLLAGCGSSSGGEALPAGAPPLAPIPATITLSDDGNPAYGGTYQGFIWTANLAGKVSSVRVETNDANPIAAVGFQFPAMLEAGKTYTSASVSTGALNPLPEWLNPDNAMQPWDGVAVLSRTLVVTSVDNSVTTGNGEWTYFDLHGTLTVELVDIGDSIDVVTLTAKF